MKQLKALFILALMALSIVAFFATAAAHGFPVAWFTLFVLDAAITTLAVSLLGLRRRALYDATLTTTDILADVLDAFKFQLPMLSRFSTKFTAQKVVKGGTLIGHIRQLPTASTYDANNGGYENGATEGKSLLVDMPITVDQHPHVPIKVSDILEIAAQKSTYQDAIRDAAYVLAKAVLDYCLGLAVAANFSGKETSSVINTDRDTLGAIRKAMNLANGGQVPRVGLVNSDVYEQFDSDSRITSKDFYGQQTDGAALGHLSNVAGFSDIWEYPTLPANGENLTGFFCDPRAIALVTGLPTHNLELADSLGVPPQAKQVVLTDPETKLSMLGLLWQQSGTFDLYMTVTLLFGASAGKQNGAQGAICDKAGYRLVSA